MVRHGRFKRGYSVADSLTVLLFVLGICLPGLDNLMDLDPTPPPHENRVKAKRPLFDLSANRLRAYPVKYRKYFNDHFGWRNWLIRTNAVLSTQVLGISPIPRRVTIGKEGWFFLNGHSGAHFRGVDPFTTEELEEWRVLLESRRDWLAARGIDFMFVLAPDKNSVYPEKLPAGVKRGIQRVDQLLEYLSEASCLRVIDLRPVLREAKTQGDVYERTGTHWNAAGTWAAYQEIMKELASSRPEIHALAEREVKFREFVRKGLGPVRMAALENVVLENDSIVFPRVPRAEVIATPYGSKTEKLFATQRPPGGRPTAVIFRDSFFTRLVRLVKEHFDRAVFVWSREFDYRILAEEKANIVIWETGQPQDVRALTHGECATCES